MKGYVRSILTFSALVGFLSLSAPSARAGGEDFETFQADCNGFNPVNNTYKRGAVCTVNLLHGTCMGDRYTAPGGYNAQVLKYQRRRWVPVTRLTHYSACEPESENGVNRKMQFRVSQTSFYKVRVDAVGDRKPAYWDTVLSVDSTPDLLGFTIRVK